MKYDNCVSASAKFHKITHWPEAIKLFGCPANYNAETWESAHRWYVKRWLGKLQHSNLGSMKSLMFRTSIANWHDGSYILDNVAPTCARNTRTVFGIRGSSKNGEYKSLYLLKYNVWVDVGQFLIYSIVGLSSTPTVARLVKINRKGSSSVALSIDKLRKCNRASVIARWTALWEFVPANNRRVILESDSANYEIDIFPMQPDFGASESSPRFLSCEHMHIM